MRNKFDKFEPYQFLIKLYVFTCCVLYIHSMWMCMNVLYLYVYRDRFSDTPILKWSARQISYYINKRVGAYIHIHIHYTTMYIYT